MPTIPSKKKKLLPKFEESTKGNKGEWSEFYAIVKLLSDGSLNILDRDSITDIENKLLYSVKKDNITFSCIDKNDDNIICTVFPSNESFTISKNSIRLKEGVSKLLKCIKRRGCEDEDKSSSGPFDISLAEEMASNLHISTKKSPSLEKADLTIRFQSNDTGSNPKPHDVSIKSWLGANPTLFNASLHSSRLIFKVISDQSFEALQKISNIDNRDARKAITEGMEYGIKFVFQDYADSTFKSNLEQIDVQNFIPYIALAHFSRKLNKASTSMALRESLINSHPSFDHKWKSFLQICALGMTAKSPYNIENNISDNFLVVDSQGQLCCYIGRNRLENILYDQSFIDTPSAKRHQYGYFYQKDGEIYIDLNFQVRLKPKKIKT